MPRECIAVSAATAAVTLGAAALVDTANRREWEVRVLTRRAWMWAVTVVPVAGPVAWLLFGRPRGPVPLPVQPMHPAQYWALQRQLARDLDAFDDADVRTG